MSKYSKDWMSVLLVFVLILGILFRFGNLHHVYWHDEAYTSIRMSGYPSYKVKQMMFKSTPVSIEDLMYYQWPNEERTFVHTMRSLAIDDAQHPPLYYLLVRQWVKVLGKSIWITRSLSVVISLMAFPAIYWLCRELFATCKDVQEVANNQRKLTAGIAMAVIAVSPFHILYAQEARQYVLWTVLTLASCAMVLRAIRLNTPISWALYTVLLVLSFYTHPFTAFVALGHGIYVLIREHFRPTRRIISYLSSLILASVIFLPWLLTMLKKGAITGTSWTAEPMPLPDLIKVWGIHIVRCFFLPEGDFGFDTWQVYLLLPILLLLVVWALYFFCVHTPLPLWLFVVLLIGASTLPLVIPDLLWGGQRSAVGRYLIPTFLGMQLAVAFFLAHQIHNTHLLARQFWQGVTIFVLMLGIVSGLGILQTETSWIKAINYNLLALSRIVNDRPKPLIISTNNGINFGTIFSLTHHLNPKVKFLLLDTWRIPDYLNIPDIPQEFTDVFLLNPSDKFRRGIEWQEKAKAELVFNDVHLYLWKLGK